MVPPPSMPADVNLYISTSIEAYGLPFAAVRSGDLRYARHTLAKEGRGDVGWQTREIPGRSLLLPTWVYWPGLLLNLLVWNATALVVFIAIDAWIGRRCIRKGRCVVCNYDIGAGANACPECGTGM